MGSAAWAQPFTIRRNPSGVAGHVQDSGAENAEHKFRAFLRGMLCIPGARSWRRPLGSATPDIIKMSDLKKILCVVAQMETLWLPMGAPKSRKENTTRSTRGLTCYPPPLKMNPEKHRFLDLPDP